MSKTINQGREEIAKLCKHFANNRQAFLAPSIKEAHIRMSLIDPFFEALGWDLRNTARIAPQYREVITEDSLEIEGQQKAPDYAFRLGTLSKFYTEAKKCGININADPGPAYQLRRYGWSAKVPLSILTDFEELGVYDCSIRPRPVDKAGFARIQYFRSEEYPDRWRELWDIFSREAVWAGAYDQFAASKRKRGTSEVDSEFLKDIEGWRDVLARNLALRNSNLSADDLNASVQLIIDRLIFLRMAEDRGLESYGQLLKLCDQPNIYKRFINGLCTKADQKYNSGLFHFEKEPGISDTPDTLTPHLSVDDNVLKPILQSLYFEHGSPYNFGVLPVEILGTVYERFLGKVIRLTAGHQAKVEEKPEVRKAGGVYYTPAYIVNYIVHNTIGKQIEGKNPTDLAGNKTKPPFRVLDMACGSGSFLLGAYQFLIDHCLKWYQANPSKKHANAVYENAKGETRLTIAERKRILTTHIFGVDIDRQAVETTKLSLLLKALEGENDTSLSRQMTLFHERALPNLSDNIKCGNSLIASDFSMLPEDLVRVHAFDWPVQFPDAMKADGFDTILGNPPYVRQETLGPMFKDYAQKHFTTYAGTADLYTYFIERAHNILKPTGFFGYIVSNKFMRANYGRPLRNFIATKTTLFQIIDFGELPVFEGAATFPAILITRNTSTKKQNYIHAAVKRLDFALLSDEIVSIGKQLDETALLGDSWTLANPQILTVFNKLKAKGTPLGDYVQGKIFYGIKTGLDKAFVIDADLRRKLIAEDSNSANVLKKYGIGDDVRNYNIQDGQRWLIFFPRGWTNKNRPPKTTAWSWISKEFPAIANHLEPFAKDASKRSDQGDYWWELRACTYYDAFERPKLVWPEIAKESRFAYDLDSLCVNKTCFICPVDDKYLLGLLNSKVIWLFLKNTCSILGDADKGGRLLQQKIYLDQVPIRRIDFSDPADKDRYNKMVGLVEKMLVLKPKLRQATSESEKTALQNAITATNAEIDRLVYKLYGLTHEEIKIVEGEH